MLQKRKLFLRQKSCFGTVMLVCALYATSKLCMHEVFLNEIRHSASL